MNNSVSKLKLAAEIFALKGQKEKTIFPPFNMSPHLGLGVVYERISLLREEVEGRERPNAGGDGVPACLGVQPLEPYLADTPVVTGNNQHFKKLRVC